MIPLKFSIRDILFVTLIVALALGWWIDRSRLAKRATETDSFQALSESLAQQLQNKNPAASIEISVHGSGVATSTGYGDPDYVMSKETKFRAQGPDQADAN